LTNPGVEQRSARHVLRIGGELAHDLEHRGSVTVLLGEFSYLCLKDAHCVASLTPVREPSLPGRLWS
jgi:hypothetical protein